MRVNNFFSKYKVINSKGEVIPPIIAKEAYQRASILLQEELRMGEAILLSQLFIFKRTPEDYDIWSEVNEGNYQSFYDFHKAQKAK